VELLLEVKFSPDRKEGGLADILVVGMNEIRDSGTGIGIRGNGRRGMGIDWRNKY